MRELYSSGGSIISAIRRVPLDAKTINSSAKSRNPINHPTVMFRKSVVIDSGNYQNCPFFEDYYLWAKILTKGYLLSNLPEVLVETEVSSDYFRRRGGVTYVRNELHLVQELRKIGFLSPIEASIFMLTRLPVRLVPVALRQHLYRTFLRTN